MVLRMVVLLSEMYCGGRSTCEEQERRVAFGRRCGQLWIVVEAIPGLTQLN